jgi:PncC family amidohydrolase
MFLALDKIAHIHKVLTARGQTLALAESCTGGLLSSEFTKRPGISNIFLGSVISYSAKVKNSILDVPMTLIQVLGEVSTPVALEMARGVRKKLKSDWAIAVTGIAGPTGGSLEKPVGTVCFALLGPGVEISQTQYFNAKLSREEIQKKSVEHALGLLSRNLDSSDAS